MLRKSVLVTALALALPAAPLFAAQSDPAPRVAGLADEIVVTATRTAEPLSSLLGDVSVISAADIARRGQSNLLELLQTQPGIEIVQSGGTGSVGYLYLRGANSGHVLVLVDGQRVGSLTTGTTPLESIDPAQIERIEILRGPASSLYGADAVAGVIQIFTRKGTGAPRASVVAGGGSEGLGKARFNYGGVAGDTRFNLGLATERSDNGFSAARPSAFGYNADDDGYRRQSAAFSVEHSVSPAHSVGLQSSAQRDRVDYDSGANPIHADNRVQHAAVWWNADLSSFWRSRLQIGVGENLTDNLSLGVSQGRFDSSQLQYQWQNEFATERAGKFLIGLERNEYRVSSSTAYSQNQRSVNAAQLGWQARFGAHQFTASARRDAYNDFGDHSTGSVGYSYEFTPAWRASAQLGTSFKAPSFNDMYWPLGFGFQGNPDLDPERGRNAEAALRYQAGATRASLTAYRNDVRDLIVYVFSPPVSTVQNVRRASLPGVSLAGETSIAGLRVKASVDWQDPEDRATGKRLTYRAATHGVFGVLYQRDAWEAGVELIASGPRFTDLANTRHVAGYARLDLHAAWRVARDWKLAARINNALDADYQLNAGYNTPGVNAYLGIEYQTR